jgi:hypothetical protein
MAKGGARVGAGRKPKKKGTNVLTMPGVPPPAVDDQAAAASRAALLEPPAMLANAVGKEDELQTWTWLAPLAIDTGMLTAQTVPGLAYLCDVIVLHDKLRKILDDEGWQITLYEDVDGHKFPMEQKRHPLWPQLQAFAIRREQGLRSFGLLANGKPVPTAEGATAGDPWAERSRRQA